MNTAVEEITDEEKRIRIAELCGWKFDDTGRNFETIDPEGGAYGWPIDEAKECSGDKWKLRCLIMCEVPDYLSDLNAMHEAEKMLSDVQFGTYHFHLCDVIEHNYDGKQRPYSTCATAAQRAEAFLKVFAQ